MWPWRKRVEVVLASTAVDDAVAALTMILRYHRKPVSLDEVRQAIYEDGPELPDAAHVIAAAERFRLRGRGLLLEDRIWLTRIPMPNIAHMMWHRGEFPRLLSSEGLYGYFTVVTSASPHRVRWIDPYLGEIDDDLTRFLELASGVFLMFDRAPALPPARIWSGSRRRAGQQAA